MVVEVIISSSVYGFEPYNVIENNQEAQLVEITWNGPVVKNASIEILGDNTTVEVSV